MACGALEIKRAALTAWYAFKLEDLRSTVSPLSFSKKTGPHGRPGGRPPGPEPVHTSFLNLGKKERGRFFVFKGLQKPLSAQIQGN